LNQNTNNLLIVDFDTAILDIDYVKYFLQSQEKNISVYFHGTDQQALKISDLNNMFENDDGKLPIKFRRIKEKEDLTRKLIFNRVGKFGVDIHA
jgi:hypothetical protein